MTVIRTFLAGAVVALIATASVAAETRRVEMLHVARGTTPPNRANPYAVGGNTFWELMSALFDTLTRVTSKGELIPWIAESWTEDPNTGAWQFKLRPGLTFSNGEPLHADAIVHAVTYLKSDEGLREPGSLISKNIKSTRAISDLVVEIVPPQRDPLLPQRMSTLWIVAPKAWQKLGREGFGTTPAGSGPYKIDGWTAAKINLSANETSWRRAPTNRMEQLVIQDPTARSIALTTGRADLAFGAFDTANIDNVLAIGGSIYPDELPAVIGVAFNTVFDPRFKDVRVRQALNYAVDKESIVKHLLNGSARVASQVGRTGFFGFSKDVAPYPYDPERAKRMLAEAGYPDGFSFEMELAQGAALWDSVFLQVASDLSRIGVTMDIRMKPNEQVLQSIQTGVFRTAARGAAYFSAAFDALDPMVQNSCKWHAPSFCDEEIDAALDIALQPQDLESRRRTTEAVMKLTHDRAQAIYVYESIGFIALGPRVKKYQADFGFIRYEVMELSE